MDVSEFSLIPGIICGGRYLREKESFLAPMWSAPALGIREEILEIGNTLDGAEHSQTAITIEGLNVVYVVSREDETSGRGQVRGSELTRRNGWSRNSLAAIDPKAIVLWTLIQEKLADVVKFLRKLRHGFPWNCSHKFRLPKREEGVVRRQVIWFIVEPWKNESYGK